MSGAHTRIIDTAINNALCIVTGCLRPTSFQASNLLSFTEGSHAVSQLPGSGIRSFALQASRPCQAVSVRSWYPFVPAAKQFFRTIKEQNINVACWMNHAWSVEWRNSASRLRSFIPDAGPRPLGLALSRPAWMRLNHLQTSVGRFHSSMHKWGMASSVICECGVEDQTADHII